MKVYQPNSPNFKQALMNTPSAKATNNNFAPIIPPLNFVINENITFKWQSNSLYINNWQPQK